MAILWQSSSYIQPQPPTQRWACVAYSEDGLVRPQMGAVDFGSAHGNKGVSYLQRLFCSLPPPPSLSPCPPFLLCPSPHPTMSFPTPKLTSGTS